MGSLKNVGDCSSEILDRNILSFSFDSLKDISDIASSSLSKRPLSMKKSRSDVSRSLSPKDMQRFLSVEQKKRYGTYKNRSVVPDRVTNLGQLKDSHISVSNVLKTQKLFLFFSLCGVKFYEKLVCLFYVNLCISKDNGVKVVLLRINVYLRMCLILKFLMLSLYEWYLA